MRIGIAAPFNPSSIVMFLEDENIPSINDSATAVNTLVHELLSQGHKLKIFTTSTKYPQKLQVYKGKNVEVYVIPSGIMPNILGNHMLIFGIFFLVKRIANIINSYIKDIDVLHAHWTYEFALAASKFSNNIPVFDTIRDWCPYQRSIQTRLLEKFEWLIKEIVFRRAMMDDHITFIANSHYTYKMAKGAYPHKDIPIIPNPITKSWIIDNPIGKSELNIVSIANGLTDPRKNITKLLEAFAMFKESYQSSKLHLVGAYNPNDIEFIRWKERGLTDGVIFHGAVPHVDLKVLLDEMYMMVHPAKEETFGNILLEAMSRGVPCIGGERAGAVPDVLGRGEFGLVCDVSSSESIFEAMIKMMDNSVYNTIRSQATQMIKDSYSSELIAKKHIELYRSKFSKDYD